MTRRELFDAIRAEKGSGLSQADVDAINAIIGPEKKALAPHPHLKPSTILAAQSSERKWRIPTAISLAQYALESAWGKKDIGVNNFFGMKVRKNKNDPYIEVPTREVIKGKSVMVNAKFRRFDSEEAAFDAHGELLATAPVYANARKALPNTEKFADALTGVYATDPNYGSALKNLMRSSNLLQYNLEA